MGGATPFVTSAVSSATTGWCVASAWATSGWMSSGAAAVALCARRLGMGLGLGMLVWWSLLGDRRGLEKDWIRFILWMWSRREAG